jgi:hypothetical protein
VEDLICTAIQERRLLELRYRDEDRIVEPYLLFESKNGHVLLHGYIWDRSAEENGSDHWCNLRLDEIQSAVLSQLRFESPRQGYNAQGKLFHHVKCCI